MGAVVLVEGESDRVALLTLARRDGHELEGVEIVVMGGVTNIRACAERYVASGTGPTLTGLYDAPEERHVRRGLAAAGVPAALEVDGLAELGFFGCDADLEDELVRALGTSRVEQVIEAEGELRSLRLLSGMPAQRGWSPEAVLRRFLGVRAGRKARYAALLTAALRPGEEPEPLRQLLARL